MSAGRQRSGARGLGVPRKVLDSYAILAFLEDESGAAIVEELLLGAQLEEIRAYMSVVNLGEVWYAVARAYSPNLADEKVFQIRQMAIEVMDADWHLTLTAAQFKAGGRIAYADCYAAALAVTLDADLVTGDKEFEVLADAVRIHWL